MDDHLYIPPICSYGLTLRTTLVFSFYFSAFLAALGPYPCFYLYRHTHSVLHGRLKVLSIAMEVIQK